MTKLIGTFHEYTNAFRSHLHNVPSHYSQLLVFSQYAHILQAVPFLYVFPNICLSFLLPRTRYSYPVHVIVLQ